jgi:hypothetical protein
MIAVLLAGCDQSHQDERIQQHITCVNNLKQIGLSLKIWAGDNNDQMPFNASTNAGGTMEFCAVDKDGFDRNSYLHFQVMSNELSTPLILICPQDPVKKVATDFASLQASNVTYRLRTGTNMTGASPRTILVVCPVDGNVLYSDGTVMEAGVKVVKEPENSMHVNMK